MGKSRKNNPSLIPNGMPTASPPAPYKFKKSKSEFVNAFNNMFSVLNDHIQSINGSKLFAGLMIITLNISTKFVNLNLPKTVEAYLKYSFSKQILVFAIAWMGTRDIYIALIITVVFIFFIDFLFNESSSMCILPESFTDYHVSKLDQVTDEEIQKAKEILAKAEMMAESKLTSTDISVKDVSAVF
jgi:hypothetical protein